MSQFELLGLRFALLICYDIEFAEAARIVALRGAHAIIAPTALAANWPVLADAVIPCRAFENGAYILYTNHAGVENNITYLGRSCVVGPDGVDVARAGHVDEILVADLDPKRVEAARRNPPYHRDLDLLTTRLTL